MESQIESYPLLCYASPFLDEDGLGMKFVGYIATSLDGFIARKDSSLDWLEQKEWADPDGSDYGWKAFLSNVDAMIMGKNTFLKILDIGEWIYGDLPVFVASSTMADEQVPEHLKAKVSIISGTAQEIAEKLRVLGKKRSMSMEESFCKASFVLVCLMSLLSPGCRY